MSTLKFCRLRSLLMSRLLVSRAAQYLRTACVVTPLLLVAAMWLTPSQVNTVHAQQRATPEELRRDVQLKKHWNEFPLVGENDPARKGDRDDADISLPVDGTPGSDGWRRLPMNIKPIIIEGKRYGGFRFRADVDKGRNFYWAFRMPTVSFAWFITTQGRMDHGFENFYRSHDHNGQSDSFVLQGLAGNRLVHKRIYLIWFKFNGDEPQEIAFRYAMRGPESLPSDFHTLVPGAAVAVATGFNLSDKLMKGGPPVPELPAKPAVPAVPADANTKPDATAEAPKEAPKETPKEATLFDKLTNDASVTQLSFGIVFRGDKYENDYDNSNQILGVVAGSPAALAGLEKDDRLVSLETSAYYYNMLNLSDLAKNTDKEVTFTFKRHLVTEPIVVKLTRAEVATASLKLLLTRRPEHFNDMHDHPEKLKKIQDDAEKYYIHGLTLLADEKDPGRYEKSAVYFHQAVLLQHARAYLKLAHFYKEGLGVPKNPERAFELLATYRSNPYDNKMPVELYIELGSMYQHGIGVAKDMEKAEKFLSQATFRGSPEAAYELALIARQGTGTPEAKERNAASHLRKALKNGHPDAAFELAEYYVYSKSEKSQDEAFDMYKLAAEGGNVKAMVMLGKFYENGRGVQQDDAQAFHWYEKAWESKHAEAAQRLGLMYQQGRGGAQADATKASELLSYAKDRGYTDLVQLPMPKQRRTSQSRSLQRR